MIHEGYMPFLEHRTYYRIVGEKSSLPPLILLHGGPGSTHNYFELLDNLDSNRQIISYDQIGCGNSYLDGHPELWTMDTWENELCALIDYLHIDRFHLLGQSWGGMLTLNHVIHVDQTKVASIILSSTLPSSSLWAAEQHRMIRQMSAEDQIAIATAEKTGDYSAPEYTKANEHFMEMHCAGPYTDKDPECITRPKKTGHESYLYGWGPNEYVPTGSLQNFDEISRLHTIKVPSLICSGTDDLCTPLVAKTMYDNIPDSTWNLYPNTRHMCFYDSPEQYKTDLRTWLNSHD